MYILSGGAQRQQYDLKSRSMRGFKTYKPIGAFKTYKNFGSSDTFTWLKIALFFGGGLYLAYLAFKKLGEGEKDYYSRKDW